MDTGLFTGEQRMSAEWERFAAFVERTEDLPVSLIVRRGCATDPGDEVGAAYDAPFPGPAAKAGARAFPGLVPRSPGAPGAAAGRRTLAALRDDRRPMLLLWGEEDPVLPLAAGEAFARALGRRPPHPVAGAGHYLQEDRGPEVGARIAEWLAAGPA
jgi:haloalkane dehalogenase